MLLTVNEQSEQCKSLFNKGLKFASYNGFIQDILTKRTAQQHNSKNKIVCFYF